jgi:hypothetical protein
LDPVPGSSQNPCYPRRRRMRRRVRPRVLTSVRTAARNFDLLLAIDACQAFCRNWPSIFPLTIQVNAKATSPEQSNTRPATVTARKLLEANSSPMVHHLVVRPAQANDCPVAQSKGLPSNVQFRSRLMFRCNTCSKRVRTSLVPPRQDNSRLLQPRYSHEAALLP